MDSPTTRITGGLNEAKSGYRQGSIQPFGPEGFRDYSKEKVDALEIGAKTRFGGPVPGQFNLSLFYNELQDQQILAGFLSTTNQASPTSGIVNAGESEIKGLELETSLALFDNLLLNIAYAYLDTELKELDLPTPPPGAVYDAVLPTSNTGEASPFTPKNSLVTTLTYLLPLPVSLGEVSAAVTHIYTDERISSSFGPFGTLEDYQLVNANLTWRNAFGSDVDIAAFVNNVLEEEYRTYVSGLYDLFGADFHNVGQPRMYGVRLRYSFGQ